VCLPSVCPSCLFVRPWSYDFCVRRACFSVGFWRADLPVSWCFYSCSGYVSGSWDVEPVRPQDVSAAGRFGFRAFRPGKPIFSPSRTELSSIFSPCRTELYSVFDNYPFRSVNTFYTLFRSLIWRCQFLSKMVRYPIWMCHCACANRFARSHHCYT